MKKIIVCFLLFTLNAWPGLAADELDTFSYNTVTIKYPGNDWSYSHGKFTIKLLDKEGEFGIYYEGGLIWKSYNYTRLNSFAELTIRELGNAVINKCNSIVFSTYSGGLHCCSTDYLLMTCANGGHYAEDINMGHSDLGIRLIDLNNDGVKEIIALDWSYAYMTRGGFAGSPAFERVLVFDKNGLRPSRIGEFKAFYKSKLKQYMESDLKKVKTAIYAAYYSLMINGDKKEALEIYKKKATGMKLYVDSGDIRCLLKAINNYSSKLNPKYPDKWMPKDPGGDSSLAFIDPKGTWLKEWP